ncbi:hypothetical protein NHQ30_011252 [Ciborinia camelliae]|nr:hypothetical protein NHQ30_011252 [Ciborinia camelliae]
MSSYSSHRPRKGSRGSSNSSSAASSWSPWEWNSERNQWQSSRTNSRGETEWEFRSDQSTSGASAIPRLGDTTPLATVSEHTAQYSANNNYTTVNNDVGALTNSLAATTLDSNANPDPQFAANLGRNNTSLEHRNFDPNYKVHDGREFKFGRAILWSEPTGNARGGTEVSTRRKHGQVIHAKVRRPIMSYGGQGTTKPGVKAQEHAIIHTTDDPQLVANEDGSQMVFRPVKMEPDSPRDHLDPASRINYAKVYTVEYNVKVWFIGRIDRNSESTVKTSYNEANPPLSLSTQTSTASSYRTDNSTYSSSSYALPSISSNASSYPTTSGHGNTISRSMPSYNSGYNTSSGSSNLYDSYGSTRQIPSTQYIPPSNPSSSNPSSQYTPSQYAPSQYTPSQYPPSQYPPSQYPPSRYPASQHPSSQYPAPQHHSYTPNTNQQYGYNPPSTYHDHGNGEGQ